MMMTFRFDCFGGPSNLTMVIEIHVFAHTEEEGLQIATNYASQHVKDIMLIGRIR